MRRKQYKGAWYIAYTTNSPLSSAISCLNFMLTDHGVQFVQTDWKGYEERWLVWDRRKLVRNLVMEEEALQTLSISPITPSRRFYQCHTELLALWNTLIIKHVIYNIYHILKHKYIIYIYIYIYIYNVGKGNLMHFVFQFSLDCLRIGFGPRTLSYQAIQSQYYLWAYYFVWEYIVSGSVSTVLSILKVWTSYVYHIPQCYICLP